MRVQMIKDVRGGEYMIENGTPEWFKAMAQAIKDREHAIAMIKRWQDKVDAAEKRIQDLSTGAESEQAVTQEQE